MNTKKTSNAPSRKGTRTRSRLSGGVVYTNLTFRIDSETLDMLEDISEVQNKSRSQVIKELIVNNYSIIISKQKQIEQERLKMRAIKDAIQKMRK